MFCLLSYLTFSTNFHYLFSLQKKTPAMDIGKCEGSHAALCALSTINMKIASLSLKA